MTATIILGGLKDADYLEDVSRICGQVEERIPQPRRRPGEAAPPPRIIRRPTIAPDELQVWSDLGRATRTIDAYGRGLAEFLMVCEREGSTR